MVSRLETALSLALLVILLSSIAEWETGILVARVPFFALLVLFLGRLIYRKSQGKSWDEARGLTPTERP